MFKMAIVESFYGKGRSFSIVLETFVGFSSSALVFPNLPPPNDDEYSSVGGGKCDLFSEQVYPAKRTNGTMNEKERHHNLPLSVGSVGRGTSCVFGSDLLLRGNGVLGKIHCN